jgi:hypothetical protein
MRILFLLSSLTACCVLAEMQAVADDVSDVLLEGVADARRKLHSGQYNVICKSKDNAGNPENYELKVWFSGDEIRWDKTYLDGENISSKRIRALVCEKGEFVSVNDSDVSISDLVSIKSYLNWWDLNAVGSCMSMEFSMMKQSLSQVIVAYRKRDFSSHLNGSMTRISSSMDSTNVTGKIGVFFDIELVQDGPRFVKGELSIGGNMDQSVSVDWITQNSISIPKKAIFTHTNIKHLSPTYDFSWQSVNEQVDKEVFLIRRAFEGARYVIIPNTDGVQGDRGIELLKADEYFSKMPVGRGTSIWFLVLSTIFIVAVCLFFLTRLYRGNRSR